MAKSSDADNTPPFDTADLRAQLTTYLNTTFVDPSGVSTPIGNYKWGVYAFFDYDGEPIYVGQTREMVRTRIRRHLTNQRTDAVAMSVLDPFEVLDIEVWPLPQFHGLDKPTPEALAHLDALERIITQKAVDESKFKAILNEKDPPPGDLVIEPPASLRGRIVSDRVHELRVHMDSRIARRALIISRLTQVIAEREVQGGLRRVLLTQAKRLQWLSERRFEALGGAASVEVETDSEV
ncbi:MAG TPA: excinuclease ABC subunit C [Hyphomonadaceae bacterium]|nr:excinuclease ABC subunit C [Hyphomonadaceae bacterium]